MPRSPDHAVLIAHRARVSECRNFQEFQEAQLDLLDYLIAKCEVDDRVLEAASEFEAKFNEWSCK